VSALGRVQYGFQGLPPAKVVGGRVVVQLGDSDSDNDAFVPSTTAPPVKTAPVTKSDPSPETVSSGKQRAPSSANSPVQRGREVVRPNVNTRLVLDIEDAAVLEDIDHLNLYRPTRANSAEPPMVELRQRGSQNASSSSDKEKQCGRTKADPMPCGHAGRFSECALCPRAGGATASSEGHIYQAPTRGGAEKFNVKVMQRNTFLTFADPEQADVQGSKKRSRSH